MPTSLLVLCLVVVTEGRLYAPTAANAVKDEKKVAVAVKPHNDAATKEVKNATKRATKNATEAPLKNLTAHEKISAPTKGSTNANKNATKNATKVPPRNLTAEEQVSAVNKGLETIMKLKAVFTSEDKALGNHSAHSDVEKFAQGAMSTELESKNSPVWGAIENMLTATVKASQQMKGKSKAEQEKMMDSLEQFMNKGAETLKNVTDRAGEVQEKHDEEYLLGVLMQHQKDWSMERQLNTTRTFESTCKAARELLKSYNKSQPLAPQLAVLMDHRKVPAAAKVAAEKSAAKLLIQLVSTLHRTEA